MVPTIQALAGGDPWGREFGIGGLLTPLEQKEAYHRINVEYLLGLGIATEAESARVVGNAISNNSQLVIQELHNNIAPTVGQLQNMSSVVEGGMQNLSSAIEDGMQSLSSIMEDGILNLSDDLWDIASGVQNLSFIMGQANQGIFLIAKKQ